MCYGALLGDSGGVRCATEVYSKSERKNPPRHSTNGPLPQGGVRYSAPELSDPLAASIPGGPLPQGACVIPLSRFILGRAMRWRLCSGIQGGVRCATEIYSKSVRRNPPRQALRLALSPKGACSIDFPQARLCVSKTLRQQDFA